MIMTLTLLFGQLVFTSPALIILRVGPGPAWRTHQKKHVVTRMWANAQRDGRPAEHR